MVNICTLEQLQVLIGKGIVKGCGCCKSRFEEDDLAYAVQTGKCPYRSEEHTSELQSH